MGSYKRYVLFLTAIFGLFIFIACNGTNDYISNVHIDTQEEDYQQNNDIYEAVVISSRGDVDLDDFWDNPKLSIQDNIEIKRNIIDIILYVYDIDVPFEDIMSTIDVHDSEDWIKSRYDNYWNPENMAELIEYIKLSHVDRIDPISLESVDAKFMIMPHNSIEEERLHISVRVYDIGSYGGETYSTSSLVYDFYFKKIDNKYKIIGVTINS